MANHTNVLATRTKPLPARGLRSGIRSTTRIGLPIFAFGSSLALVLVPIVNPSAAFALTSEVTVAEARAAADDSAYFATVDSDPQYLTAAGAENSEVDRGRYKVIAPEPEEPEEAEPSDDFPAAGKPDPGSAKDIALQMTKKRGWGYSEYTCLVNLWNKESSWNVYAHNVGSGAYGIPQALPGEKMASVGSDWKTSASTQIKWGLGYIEGRYGTPCGAWASSQARGWY